MTQATSAKPNLYQRLVAVKQAVGKIGKDGTAPAVMGGFKFVAWESVADKLGDILAEHGVVMLPAMPAFTVDEAGKTGSGKVNWRTTIRLSLTLVNADDPAERVELVWHGVGDDTSDKGMQKAATSATKYLLMKLFMLGGMGGAADSDATPAEEPAPPGKAKSAAPPARSNGMGDDFKVIGDCPICASEEITAKSGKPAKLVQRGDKPAQCTGFLLEEDGRGRYLNHNTAQVSAFNERIAASEQA